MADVSQDGATWDIYWDPGFEESLGRMGITWETFDRLGKFGVDFVLHQDPYEPESTFPLGGTASRVIQTDFHAPDLPRMLIGYVASSPLAGLTERRVLGFGPDDAP